MYTRYYWYLFLGPKNYNLAYITSQGHEISKNPHQQFSKHLFIVNTLLVCVFQKIRLVRVTKKARSTIVIRRSVSSSRNGSLTTKFSQFSPQSTRGFLAYFAFRFVHIYNLKWNSWKYQRYRFFSRENEIYKKLKVLPRNATPIKFLIWILNGSENYNIKMNLQPTNRLSCSPCHRQALTRARHVLLLISPFFSF